MSALTPIRRAILDLVGALSYEGLERTQTALIRDQATRIPTLEPNPFPNDKFRCSNGVPDVFVRACILGVDAVRQRELWGVEYPHVDADLRYLIDRRLLDPLLPDLYTPELGAFINPHDGIEVVSTFERIEDDPLGFQHRWLVRVGAITYANPPVRPDGFVILARSMRLLTLTTKALDLREPLPQTRTALPEGETCATGDGQGDKKGVPMSQHIEVRDSPGAKVNVQTSGDHSSNQLNEEKPKDNSFRSCCAWIAKAVSWFGKVKGWWPLIAGRFGRRG